MIPGIKYEMISYAQNTMERKINDFIKEKDVNCFISAGGDGALNHLVNILHRIFGPDLSHVTVGGIGLGSSNDFIKPAKTTINKVPIRLNFENIQKQDLGIVRFRDKKKADSSRHQVFN